MMLRCLLFNVIACLWKANEIFKCLYAKYSSENPDSPLSYGFFLKQAFYVRNVTTKDVEIYYCKKHLHARWAVSALLQLCKQQILNQISLITISFSTSFPDNHTTIVNWDCAKDKKILCSHASVKWSEIKQKLIEKCDPSKTVRMKHFIKVKTTTNKDKEVTKVTATETNRSIQLILNFIDQLASKMINHRNRLQVFDTQSSSKC